jgi:hypothetical protein
MNFRISLGVFLFFCLIHKSDGQNINYYLTFSSRPAVAAKLQFGHAFVSWNIEDEDEDELTFSKTVGFFPKIVISPLNSPGVLKEGWKTNSTDNPEIANFTVSVDKKTFFETLKLRDKWKNRNYKMISGEACTDFMNDVAKKAGLETPSAITYTTKYPPSYLQLLIEKNKAKEISPPVMPKDAIPKKKKNHFDINYQSTFSDSITNNSYSGKFSIPFDVIHGTVSVKKYVGTVNLDFTSFPKSDSTKPAKKASTKTNRYRVVADIKAEVVKGKEIKFSAVSMRFYKGVTARKIRKKSEAELEKYRVKGIELEKIIQNFEMNFISGETKTWDNKGKKDLPSKHITTMKIEIKRK